MRTPRLRIQEIHYHDIPNAAHRGELASVCNALGLIGNAVEVGVWHGGFSRHNLQTWNGSRYYMIDAWSFRANHTVNGALSRDKNINSTLQNERDYNIARDAVAPWLMSGRAVILRRFAEAAVHDFPDQFFDFIYLDAGHDFMSVMRDLRAWFPKLRKGGMLAGDDFADEHDTFPRMNDHAGWHWGVKSAVAQFARSVRSPFFLTFADRSHVSTHRAPKASKEFDDDDRTLHLELDRVRAHQYYPAWYLFK